LLTLTAAAKPRNNDKEALVVSKKGNKKSPAEPQAAGPKTHYFEPGEIPPIRLNDPIYGVLRGKNERGERIVITIKNLDSPGRPNKRTGPKGYIKEARRLAREMLPTWTEGDRALAERIAEIIRINYRYQSADDPIISEEWIMREAIAPEKRALSSKK
jgi:hypothetical protein